MELIDKSAVKAEIERRLDELYNMLPDTSEVENGIITISEVCNTGKYTALESFKDYLDTLEVKEVEEPSNDLEEAARKVGQKYFPDENNIWARPNYEAIAAANAFKEGAKWQEEQIMKDAIEREVKEDAGGYPYIDATELYDYENDRPLAKAGDKIKVLIVKE